MKAILYFTAAFLTACGSDIAESPPPPTPSPSVEQIAPPSWGTPEYKLKQERITQHFISDKEPTVKDATWTAHDIFMVAVFATKNERHDGYAQYVCTTIQQDFCLSDERIWVKVVDMEEILRGHFKTIGEAWCEPETSADKPILMEFIDGKMRPAKDQSKLPRLNSACESPAISHP